MAHFVFSSFATVIWPSSATFCNDEHSKPCIDKAKTVANAPNKDSTQPVHQQSLIKVCTVNHTVGFSYNSHRAKRVDWSYRAFTSRTCHLLGFIIKLPLFLLNLGISKLKTTLQKAKEIRPKAANITDR